LIVEAEHLVICCDQDRRMPVEYVVMIYSNEADWDSMTQAEQEARMAAHQVFYDAMVKAGVIKSADRLQPTTSATTVRVVDGKRQVLDGPYAESKEQLAGFFVIDVPDLDAAISWAAQCPGASHGVLEVRPKWSGSSERMIEGALGASQKRPTSSSAG
jgi:hypothetical protein